jgi:hypothetical protein
MSDPLVPCRAPYRLAAISADKPTVLLNVGRGDDMQTFIVAAVLLCRSSEYFNDR